MGNWDYSTFWTEAIKQIQSDFSKQSRDQEFKIWFSSIKYINSDELAVNISVPSNFYQAQIKQRGYDSIIQNKLKEISGQDIIVRFIVLPQTEQNTENSSKSSDEAHNTKTAAPENSDENHSSVVQIGIKNDAGHPQLRADYTFDSFVSGENAFAYNAAQAVAKNPGYAYNPLLIYGGVGLGKTHLMQAIGNLAYTESQSSNTKKNIIYITAETFTNEFIQSIHSSSQTKFKNKYRSADILLIDDIHFFQNKDGTQEELFHTFNALYDSFKQIVFTCDRPISELKNLTERLRSRFERGLNVDLQVPQYETRRAILEKKMSKKNIHISPEIIDIIAQNVSTNVRDLEASLTKIIAYTELTEKEVSVEKAQQLLRDIFNSPKTGNITIDDIQKTVANYYNISFSDIKSKKRSKNILFPRQIAMYIARQITEFSLTELGAEFGGKDHTTVMHSIEKIEETLQTDITLENTLQTLIRSIKEIKK